MIINTSISLMLGLGFRLSKKVKLSQVLPLIPKTLLVWYCHLLVHTKIYFYK